MFLTTRTKNYTEPTEPTLTTGIAMAATLGMLVQENYRYAGYLSPSAALEFKDVPNGLAAMDVVPLLGWTQMVVVIGLHEIFIRQRANKAPGDFGTGYFGVALDDQSARQLRLLNVEVSNGRLAMLGILGMFASETIHGEALWETHVFGGK
jgi:light-harvesting complex I chlorophyll a/b binding protein 1